MTSETHYLEKELRRLIQSDQWIFDFLQKGSLDGIWYWDLENPENEWMSPEFWTTLGYDPGQKEHLSAEWQSLIHPEDLRLALDNFNKHCADPDHPYDQIVRYRHQNGSTVWIRCRGIAIRDETGRPVRMLGAHNEITAQKETELALLETAEALKRAQEVAKIGCWWYDPETQAPVWTEEMFRIFGLEPQPRAPSYAEHRKVIHPDDWPCFDAAVARAVSEGIGYDLELRIIRPDGHIRHVKARCVCEKRNGGVVSRLIGTTQDITDQKKAENDLRQSEARYRTVIETITEGVILQDASGKILTWNQGAENIFGITAEAAVGQTSESKPWRTIREDGSAYEGRDHPSMRTLATGQPCRNELMGVYQPSGELRWISVNTNPLFQEGQEKPHAVAISFTDITRRKLDVDRLRRSREELKRTLEATTDGIWTWNFKTNRLHFSPRYYTMLGYKPGAFPADYEGWVNLLHPDDREKALAVAEVYLRTKADSYENEFRLRAASGDYRWIRTRARVVERDENGQDVYMIGNHEDITEKVKSREAKELMLSRYKRKAMEMEALFNGTRLLLEETGFEETARKIFDICRQLTGARSGYVALLSRDGEENEVLFLESGGLPCNVNPDLPMPIRGLRAVAYKSGQPVFDNDFVNSRWMKYLPGSHVRLDNVMFVPLKEDGLTIGLIGLANKPEDFTDDDAKIVYSLGELAAISLKQGKIREMLAQREKQLLQVQKLESIGTLAGGIAHDFNNLLYPILGYTELLMDDLGLDNPLLKDAQKIYHSALRASELVRQILVFSRQTPVELKPVKIQSAIDEVMHLIRHSLPSTIRIDKAVDETCPPVTADEGQLHQVIMNLVTNAYQAMSDTGGRIEIRLEQLYLNEDEPVSSPLSAGEYVCFSVSDTGPGIGEEILGRIFDPYFTTKEKGKGTGLGLAITHNIIKNFGGDIRVFSQPDSGAMFQVYLPVARLESSASAATADQGDLQGRQEHILFVDDEIHIGEMVKQILDRLNYRVSMKTSSLEALALFRENPDSFDLVITDMIMPHLTGIDLTKAVQSVRRDMPIILCTGFSEQIDDKKAERLGIRALIMKPVVRDQLAAAIRKVLDGRQSKQ